MTWLGRLAAASLLSCLGWPGEAAPPALASEASLRAFLQAYHSDYRNFDPDLRYSAALIDLDGDRRPEAVVQIIGPRYCGTGGCSVEIFAIRNRSWRLVSNLSIAHPPIRALDSRTHGWRDLSVVVAGGGVIPGYEARLRFNGRSYPFNPSVPPAQRLVRTVPGRVLIARGAPGRRLF